MKILNFLEGAGADNVGRTLHDYLKFTPEEFESKHDFIQWAFPSDQPSSCNPHAPILTEEEAKAIRCSFVAQRNLGFLWALSETMYRLRLTVTGTHNELRASRIIRSLTILSCDEMNLGSKAFEFFITTYYDSSSKVRNFWITNRFQGKKIWR